MSPTRPLRKACDEHRRRRDAPLVVCATLIAAAACAGESFRSDPGSDATSDGGSSGAEGAGGSTHGETSGETGNGTVTGAGGEAGAGNGTSTTGAGTGSRSSTAAAASTSGAGGSVSGAGGAAGATCTPDSCDPLADCDDSSGQVECNCRSPYVGDGTACRRPASCRELANAHTGLPSGAYTLRPEGSAEFTAYCDMSTQGGGWTLAFNQGPSFDAQTEGADQLCYSENCISRAYSTVPLVADVMLDGRDGAITGESFWVRVVVVGVHELTRGKTLRQLFTTGPYFVEREDNSNLSVMVGEAVDCSLVPRDFDSIICGPCASGTGCGSAVITFGDPGSESSCPNVQDAVFAIGASISYTAIWDNCAGWPQSPNRIGNSYYPDNFRLWVR